MDGFRRAKRLYTAADTYRWLEQRGMSLTKLEEYVGDQAIVARLREQVAAGRVHQYFESHRADFDRAYIARVELSDEDHAQRVYEQIRAAKLTLTQAAQQRFLETEERPARQAFETFAVLRRGEAPADLAAAVFGAAAGAVLPPVRTGDGYAVIEVLAMMPACLDGPTRTAIEHVLFREWLDERRRTATIEWYWGNAARTSEIQVERR
jgi:putative peptide maturation system protein